MSEAKEGYRGARNQNELGEFMERLRELNKYLIISVGEQPEPPAAADTLKPILEVGESRLDEIIDYTIFTNPWYDELESDTAKISMRMSAGIWAKKSKRQKMEGCISPRQVAANMNIS